MNIDLNLYIVNKPFILRWCKNRQDVDLVKAVSMLSAMTFCPTIAIAYWLGEEYGWPQDIVDCILRIQEFYHYEIVANKPINSPV